MASREQAGAPPGSKANELGFETWRQASAQRSYWQVAGWGTSSSLEETHLLRWSAVKKEVQRVARRALEFLRHSKL
jgi:hypothetical protein